MHQYEDSNIKKKTKTNYSGRDKHRQHLDKQKNQNKFGNSKKNNCMTISSDKLSKSSTRTGGHGYEREISREKLNIFE